MAHIAIQEYLDGKAADWMEKVSDKQYQPDQRLNERRCTNDNLGERGTQPDRKQQKSCRSRHSDAMARCETR